MKKKEIWVARSEITHWIRAKVMAYPITAPYPNVSLYVYLLKEKGKQGIWYVIEKTTGLAVSSGHKMRVAIESANQKLIQLGEKKIKKHIKKYPDVMTLKKYPDIKG